jgi:hypothetical protein
MLGVLDELERTELVESIPGLSAIGAAAAPPRCWPRLAVLARATGPAAGRPSQISARPAFRAIASRVARALTSPAAV